MRELPNTPFVSVVIPCYNQAHFLSEAIESALDQDYPAVEVVVVNDGSTDNTAEVAARYSDVKCVQQENQGLSAARNAGIRHSEGEYLVFLDADDRLLPHAISTGMEHLLESPESAFVAGGHRFIDVDGNLHRIPQLPPGDARDHYKSLLTGNKIWTPATVIFRRFPLREIGGFDEDLSACEDYDAYLNLARNNAVIWHQHVVAEYREHPKSMSTNAESMLITSLAVLRRQLPHITHSQSYKAAYKKGRTHWKEVYGIKLLQQIKVHIQTPGKQLKGLREGYTLLKHAPWWFVKHTAKKLNALFQDQPHRGNEVAV